MPSNRDERSSGRRSIAREASIVSADGASSSQVKILDISPSGFKAEVNCDFEVGESIGLLISFDLLKARIQWYRDNLIGCEFSQKLDHHKVISISRNGYFGDTGIPST
jgi:hypothetical protein